MTTNVISISKARKVSGLEGLVTIETLSALISLYGSYRHVGIDYTIGQPCGCAFCALRARCPEWFRADDTGDGHLFFGLGGVGLTEHLK